MKIDARAFLDRLLAREGSQVAVMFKEYPEDVAENGQEYGHTTHVRQNPSISNPKYTLQFSNPVDRYFSTWYLDPNNLKVDKVFGSLLVEQETVIYCSGWNQEEDEASVAEDEDEEDEPDGGE